MHSLLAQRLRQVQNSGNFHESNEANLRDATQAFLNDVENLPHSFDVSTERTLACLVHFGKVDYLDVIKRTELNFNPFQDYTTQELHRAMSFTNDYQPTPDRVEIVRRVYREAAESERLVPMRNIVFAIMSNRQSVTGFASEWLSFFLFERFPPAEFNPRFDGKVASAIAWIGQPGCIDILRRLFDNYQIDKINYTFSLGLLCTMLQYRPHLRQHLPRAMDIFMPLFNEYIERGGFEQSRHGYIVNCFREWIQAGSLPAACPPAIRIAAEYAEPLKDHLHHRIVAFLQDIYDTCEDGDSLLVLLEVAYEITRLPVELDSCGYVFYMFVNRIAELHGARNVPTATSTASVFKLLYEVLPISLTWLPAEALAVCNVLTRLISLPKLRRYPITQDNTELFFADLVAFYEHVRGLISGALKNRLVQITQILCVQGCFSVQWFEQLPRRSGNPIYDTIDRSNYRVPNVATYLRNLRRRSIR